MKAKLTRGCFHLTKAGALGAPVMFGLDKLIIYLEMDLWASDVRVRY